MQPALFLNKKKLFTVDMNLIHKDMSWVYIKLQAWVNICRGTQLILFIPICLTSLLYKYSDPVVHVSVHACVNFQKRERRFEQMVKSNIFIDFHRTLPIRDEEMMVVGGGDKLINQSWRPKCGYCF